MATHSSILAWRIPWMEEPTVHGVAKSWTRLSDFIFTFTFWEVWVGGSCLPATWRRQVFMASAAGILTDSALILPPNAFEVLLPPKPQMF